MDEFRQRFFLHFFLICSLITHTIYVANDTINIGQNITDSETLVSAGGAFELRFWRPESSGNRYVAICYEIASPFPVAVWIANRQVPIRNKSGVLTVRKPGILVLLNDTGAIVWNSTTSRPLQNPVAQLLDSGNLVMKDANDDRPENYVWQSFDHPTDTFLPGMKIGWNFVTGVETYLSSWTSDDDPASGQFSLHLDPTGYPQIVVKKGEAVTCRVVPWTGLQRSGPQDSTSRLTLEMNKNEVYYREDRVNGSNLWRSLLYRTGESRRYAWNSQKQDWSLYRSTPNPEDTCDSSYNYCGAYGICNLGNSPLCGCLYGFLSKNPDCLARANGSTRCTRRTPLKKCSRTDVFLNYSGIKLPDSRNSSFSNHTVSNEECRKECLRNCSCTAYTQLDTGSETGRGCLFYYGDLINIKNMSEGGHDLYIRMDSSDQLENGADESKGNKRVILIASLTSAVGVILLVLGLISFIVYNRQRKNDPNMQIEGPTNVSQRNDSELPLFELSTILKATDNFSIDNRLGQGGFGAVYRGVLDGGEEIAVKRLSKSSAQGVDELKNEVILIAKLQHRNLVRLLGCCLEGEENMLIYEYVPNKSLDQIIFDQSKSMLLDWGRRFNIINGIAKGLLYLHQDSRFRIIHRDLKASNILLDSEMNPRISDFGLARIFGEHESEVQTSKVVGTYGYMPPEYIADGLFSVESDVYSFGVLVLEIISGKKNRGLISLGNHYLNLLGHAWKLDREGDPLTIVDAVLGDAFDSSEVLRSIHVALLCVQMYPEDRPNMSSVVFMLGNEVAVPQARQPAFYAEREVLVADISTSTKATSSVSGASSTSTRATGSVNEVTITHPVGR